MPRSHAWQHQRQPNFATIGNARSEPVTPRRTGYELRDAAGKVIQSSESLKTLQRFLGEKRDCVVYRCRDQQAVAWSPRSEVVEAEAAE